MFKAILPSKRIASGDFTMLTPLTPTMGSMPNGKENHPEFPNSNSQAGAGAGPGKGAKQTTVESKTLVKANEKKKRVDKSVKGKEHQQQPLAGAGMEVAFDKLLDDLQIPASLRPKLLGMDSGVKSAMLKSSQTLIADPKFAPPAPETPRTLALRRTRSSESVGSPRPNKVAPTIDFPDPIRPSSDGLPSAGISAYSRRFGTHARGLSIDNPAMFSKSQVHLPASMSTTDLVGGLKAKDKAPVLAKNISPTRFCSLLMGTSSVEIDIENIKKLRLMLRNESASWTQEFLSLGGYSALLTRLNEILEVEWREEQHDDQVLHELLRCFKALSTSSIGCFALRSSSPTPFVQLIALLYSDKKPGEVASRQLIVDLLIILFELYPPSSLPSAGFAGSSGRNRPHKEAWESEADTSSNLITLPAPHKTLFSLIRALLLTPAPPPSESPAAPVSPHAFIESLHRPRIYKTYLQELSDVCRDYFWVFCHPNNTIWVLSETDESRVEKPRAPGGMTGGVEFEAMAYLTTHLKLINTISQCVAGLKLPKDNDMSAFRFHYDLFLSGFERIVLIARKASTTYYPNLHLELARYIDHATRAGYELPYMVSRLIGLPPQPLAKSNSPRSIAKRASVPLARPGLASPTIPSPIKIDLLKYE